MGGCSNWPAGVPGAEVGMLGGWRATGAGGGFSLAVCLHSALLRRGGSCHGFNNGRELKSDPIKAIPSLLFGVINLDFVSLDSRAHLANTLTGAGSIK